MKTLRSIPVVAGALALGALFLTACISDNSSTVEKLPADQAGLTISMKVGDKTTAKSGALGKGSLITLKKLVVTLTSNVSSDAVIRDTIIASDTVGSNFKSVSTAEQTFNKRYKIIPLRNWTVVVKTFDTRDSIIHRDSTVALALLAGETRAINLNLAARFVMYQVKFQVPDSIVSGQSHLSQRLIITRFVLKIDSATAVDSTRIAGFAGKPTTHTMDFDYILANTKPDVTIRFYGHSVGTNDTLLFEKIIQDVDPEVVQEPVIATYVGPGADGNGGANGDLKIVIGKINTIVFNTEPGPVPFKRPVD